MRGGHVLFSQTLGGVERGFLTMLYFACKNVGKESFLQAIGRVNEKTEPRLIWLAQAIFAVDDASVVCL